MSNRQGVRADARRRSVHLLRDVGDELREARLRTGLTQVAVAAALGTTRRRIGWIETGRAALTVPETARHAAIVGLRLSLKFYPAHPELRDAAQVALLTRLRARLPRTAIVRLESPLPEDRDRRAWDMLLIQPSLTIGVEAITRLRDVQAQLRLAQLKRRDGGVNRLILLVAATHANRRALALAEPLVRSDLTVSPRAALAALAAGTDPGGDALILL